MNLFDLAEIQLRKEKRKVNLNNVLDYAIRIRRFLDLQERNRKVLKNRYTK